LFADGRWGEWSDWDECTSTCNGGFQNRLRFCDNPPPSEGGTDCSETNIDSETQTCNVDRCPVGKTFFSEIKNQMN
jgi:hypothetical protein